MGKWSIVTKIKVHIKTALPKRIKETLPAVAGKDDLNRLNPLYLLHNTDCFYWAITKGFLKTCQYLLCSAVTSSCEALLTPNYHLATYSEEAMATLNLPVTYYLSYLLIMCDL